MNGQWPTTITSTSLFRIIPLLHFTRYAASGKTFAFVGPLIALPGAPCVAPGPQLATLEARMATARRWILVSLGTVITGESRNHGWGAKDGYAITGKQLCQAVFEARRWHIWLMFDDCLGGADLQSWIR